MRSVLKWFGRGLFALAVASLVMASGPGAATAIDCPNPKPDPYLCPPLTEQQCDAACRALEYEMGHCFGPGCCTCAI